MKNLFEVGNECLRDLKAIGLVPKKKIKWVTSARMRKTWGLCSTCFSWNYIEIKIASFLLEDDAPEQILRNTVMHELAHAIDNNEHGHGKKWLEIANLISDCYNLDITQYVRKDEIVTMKATGLYEGRKEYKVECKVCGKIYKEMGYRKTKLYTHPEDYRCSCGGDLRAL